MSPDGRAGGRRGLIVILTTLRSAFGKRQEMAHQGQFKADCLLLEYLGPEQTATRRNKVDAVRAHAATSAGSPGESIARRICAPNRRLEITSDKIAVERRMLEVSIYCRGEANTFLISDTARVWGPDSWKKLQKNYLPPCLLGQLLDGLCTACEKGTGDSFGLRGIVACTPTDTNQQVK